MRRRGVLGPRPLAVVLLLLLGPSGCDDGAKEKPIPPRERRDIVTATAQRTTTPPAASTASTTAQPRRALCTADSARLKPPDKSTPIDVARASGARLPPTPIPFGQGKWIWVNLWAAWCKPCIAEMPRLVQWQAELRQAGVSLDVAFVSLDDDERQLQRFLDSQQAGGVRATYWLREEQREKWLEPLGVKPTARLPVHALISPQGKVRCFIDGVVDERDYPRITKLVRGGS